MKKLNHINFENMSKEIEKHEAKRSKIITEGRQLIKTSKKLIYSVQREDKTEAKKYLIQIKKEFLSLNKLLTTSKLENVGAYGAAIQEYVEAVCFYEFVFNDKIPSEKELKLKDIEHYLTGLSDLTGELTRFAFKKAMEDDFKAVENTKQIVDEIFSNLSTFDFPNGEMRKKFDSIKYHLKRLEDLSISIKFRK